MKGFILYNAPRKNSEIELILQEAKKQSIECSIVNPREIAVIASNDTSYLLINGKKTELPDFVIVAFANDFTYSNLALLKQLESMGVLCINRADVMKTTQDKLLTTQLLAEANIPVPKTMLISYASTVPIIESQFSYPIVLKIFNGQKGNGVLLLHNRSELENILQLQKADSFKEELILQEMIHSSRGRDIRVMTFNKEPMCCMLREASSKEQFKSNYSTGGTVSPYKLTPQIIEISKKVAKTLDIFISGIDLLFLEDGFLVCEVNSMPGFNVSSDNDKLWGVDVPKVVLKSIIDALS